MVIGLLDQLVAGDLEAPREHDAALARWSVDDVAYDIVVRVRLPWRLEAPPAERVDRCLEAIEIIDQAAPFANAVGLAFFRAFGRSQGEPSGHCGGNHRIAGSHDQRKLA